MTSLLQRAAVFERDLIELRRDLHRHPELAFQEHRTADIAARNVEALGFRVRRDVGRTGVVAEIGSGGPVVALRADMDALPIQESSDVDYRSTVEGVMHACGHDAHVAMLIGAARLIADRHVDSGLGGTVRLLFQPSEEASDDEGMSGAMRMIADGAMDRVDAVFGLHIGANLTSGLAHISPGPIMAGSDLFRATVHGRSSHAGRPQEGIDAILLMAHAIIAAQMGVSRRIAPDDQGVISMGTITGGFAENVLAEQVSVRGTLRYFRPEVRRTLHDSLQRAFSVAETLGGSFEIALHEGYPPVVNDPDATALAARSIEQVLGADAVVPFPPMMYAEDFSLLAQQAPGCFIWLGAALDRPREHHHPAFDIDEDALHRGAAALAACAFGALQHTGT